jgi:hypothetical protein
VATLLLLCCLECLTLAGIVNAIFELTPERKITDAREL